MGVVGSDLATQWSTLFETLFLEEYNQNIAVALADLKGLLNDIPLGDHQGNQVQLDWLGAAPQMREWLAEKQPAGLNKQSFSAVVKRYEASINVDMDAFKDARFNPYELRIREMSRNAMRLPYELVSGLISGGSAALCYDGQFFFDTDHAEGSSGTQSNTLTGSGTTQANIETDFYLAMAAINGFKDDKAKPMSPTTFRPLVWIPNSGTMIQRFRTLQGATVISQTNNVLVNSFDIVVDPTLTDTNDWFMFRKDGVMKPFILVDREQPHYADNFDSKSDDVFLRRVGTASVEARMVATYGMWQMAVKVAN